MIADCRFQRRSSGRLLRSVYALTALLVGVSIANADIIDPIDPVDQSPDSFGRADGMRFVPDVVGQFKALTERPEALGFHIDGTVDPSFCKHYQAIVRVDAVADGTPYFLLTRSGNDPDIPGSGIACDDSDGERGMGNLVVVRMGSRDKNGERLRSNRLRKGVHVDNTTPPSEDKATTFFTVMENGLVPGHGGSPRPPRAYAHPGGMQVIGHTLALATDTPFPGTPLEPHYEVASRVLVMFFDVSNPEAPVLTSVYEPIDRHFQPLLNADGIAITPLADGRYLMVVTGGFGGPFFFYGSNLANSAETPNVLASPNLSWTLIGTAPAPGTEDAHQSLHFIREGNINGDLYLAGARGHPVFSDHDRIDLYRVTCPNPNCTTTPIGLEKVIGAQSRRLTPFPNTGGTPIADLAAATGFYESPSGELLFYATQHENEGPNSTVNAGEWRHIDVVRPNSPTYLPTTSVDGPFSVDEGGSVDLTGSAAPPITKAWIELFHHTNYGEGRGATYYPMVDYDDHDLDDYDDFHTLEYQTLVGDDFHHNDAPSSWKWFAPAGCRILALDHNGPNGTLDETKTLVGDGLLHSDPDLSSVHNDGGPGADNIDEDIDAVEFLSGCDNYYTEPFILKWDLDLDGSYETMGSPVTFNASAFDGPSQFVVPVQAQSSTGGAAGQATAGSGVIVRNVAPQIQSALLLDPAGNQLGTEVSAGLPLTLNATFTDQGRLDTQTASLDWGDGSLETAFDSFSDARSGALGRLIHQHRYAAGTYTLRLTVKDDDGGTTSTTRTVVAKPADLSLAMKGPGDINVQVGGEVKLNYTITVTNAGPGVAGVIAVSDTSPSGTQFVGASMNGGVCQGPPVGSGGTIKCSIGTLQNGASTTMTLVIKMRPALLGITKVTNTATVSAGSTDPNPTNNAASAQSRVISLLSR